MNTLLSKNDLRKYFNELGIKSGMIVEVHASLSKFPYIIGGAETFNDALLETIGYNGTLIMPLHCMENAEPSYFEFGISEPDEYAYYRANMPAFDARKSETWRMSKVVDNLRRREETVISNHPTVAFAALGKYAKLLCNQQNLSFALNEQSALGRLYALKAFCLLAGVGFESMTSLHLAEYKSEIRPVILNGAALKEGDETIWRKYLEIDFAAEDGFKEIGERLRNKGLVRELKIADCLCQLVRIDTAVDEGIRYYKRRKEI